MKSLNPNFTCFTGYWEIDGNLGITASIAEMLLQSRAGEIDLLSALPTKYPTGYVTGLRARGGYQVDMYWSGGKLEKAIITADKISDSQIIRIRYQNQVKIQDRSAIFSLRPCSVAERAEGEGQTGQGPSGNA